MLQAGRSGYVHAEQDNVLVTRRIATKPFVPLVGALIFVASVATAVTLDDLQDETAERLLRQEREQGARQEHY